MATVTVEVDLSDFDDDELLAELHDRGLLDLADEQLEEINAMYYALKFGKDDIAMKLLRTFVCDLTGRIL